MHTHSIEHLSITGIVQGVGFRPFIHALAHHHGLGGYVLNTPDGVEIEVEGTPDSIERFVSAITGETPPLAQIANIVRTRLPVDGDSPRYHAFSIRASSHDGRSSALVSPDACTCGDCLNELFDPSDRRYLYPFINCTNCGPRFTIIRGLPYDRPLTTMSSFAMCPDCAREYGDPSDRRFHAQPDACPVCGPRLTLLDNTGAVIAGDPVVETIRLLRDGRIVAIKSLGGFHLAADGTNEDAVRRLRMRKHREEKPFALMTGNLASARRLVSLTSAEEQVMVSRARPIVLAPCQNDAPAAPSVAPGNGYLGVMLPAAPVHFLLFYHPGAGGCYTEGRAVFDSLVMTSGNLSEEPVCRNNSEALDRLAGIADAFLMNDRDIHVRADDSVVTAVSGEPSFIRRSRGYAPLPVYLPIESPSVLALGAELKNTVCVTSGRRAFLSQHIGDLENVATLDFYREAVGHFTRMFDLSPQIIAHDLHPGYLSTRYFEEYAATHNSGSFGAVGIQHHHAHIAGVLAEHGRSDTVIGLAWDGTGYGADGTVWGGEVLIASPESFTRAAHLMTVHLPGGEKAVREHWRMAFSWLRATYGEDWRGLDLPCLKTVPQHVLEALDTACARGINSPLTSSLGRLFDTVASLIGLRQISTFEGQGAMELDLLAATAQKGNPLPYEIEESMTPDISFPVLSGTLAGVQLSPVPTTQTTYILDMRPAIRAIVGRVLSGGNTAQLALDFHETLMDAFHVIVRRLRDETGLRTVALSGGCWQNRIMASHFPDRLRKDGFEVLINRLVPVNDGGISLGQAYVAAMVGRNVDIIK
jgi:hydrogenase maturation protein HypF